jgi:uncharacterized sulfatase
MSSALRGEPAPPRKEEIFWQRPPDRKVIEGLPQPDLAVRQGDFKLLINADSSKVELYDLSRDSGETNNIASKHPNVVKKLSSRALSWNRSLPRTK